MLSTSVLGVDPWLSGVGAELSWCAQGIGFIPSTTIGCGGLLVPYCTLLGWWRGRRIRNVGSSSNCKDFEDNLDCVRSERGRERERERHGMNGEVRR